jgi:hypothetical protein
MIKLNIFYEEPNPDRWFKFDRYPRKVIRRLIRGKQRPGGVMMVALELMRGLERLEIPYRFNDFKYIKKHPEEVACIIGKPQLLDKFKWKNPIIFGAGIFSHPIDCPDLLISYPTIKKILVPGPWMKDVFDPYYGKEMVAYWPVGIDTEKWNPEIKKDKIYDFLIYDKIRWDHNQFKTTLIDPILAHLDILNLSYTIIRYGNYSHDDLLERLSECSSAIFLCEHETQGQAYQQMLATGTPIFAWDRNGFWQDPYYYPHRVQYEPVTAVPYWDDRCGLKFSDITDFKVKLADFIKLRNTNILNPRLYILENLTLEKCALQYYKIYQQLKEQL